MGRIGIYGGSFNPPHVGHTLAMREMVRALDLDRLILIPALAPPHKKLESGSPDAETRLEMLRLATEGMERVVIDDQELRRDGPSYTSDTVHALHKRYPDDRLYLLMGTDMFLSFDSWHKPEKICRYAALAVVHRETADPALTGKMQEQAKKLRKQFDAEVVVLDNQVEDMSSTETRRMLHFQCADTYLAPRLLEYIRQKGLYGTAENWKNLPFEQLRKISLSLHNPKRVPHVIGCCETAARLARRWGADEAIAARCGILHDVTKALGKRAQLLLCEKYGIMTNAFERENYKLLHSRTGAAVARHIFGECDEVYDAIYWHTTGKANMTLMEKILYISDYMEPQRSFDGVETLRELTERDLDAALLCGFEMSIALLESEGKALDRYTVEARDYLQSERTKE
ncbi:MAG TPA: nicotinate (nicotinamide) nucleotide adenylyltransferase [Candidatus Avoscillospira avistercoris]|uniref:Probable nicotinate-nucleotide adenylyltransferase n=1 Tax=Candidatus Avoscillospira avistercoris TaxID=2840707 RepID=A0A9D1FBB4_9FIRM|nr:nicotinate (nicotinamide) nucleotide adenylyltransferase [Candidatus Avoscillospira avistercoris]